jgi:cytidyltransferase-like protein
MKRVAVSGSFDDLPSRQVRLLEEAAKLGDVSALVWDDETVSSLTGKPPKFPAAERLYVTGAIRFVGRASIVSSPDDPFGLMPKGGSEASAAGPEIGPEPDIWAVTEEDDHPRKREFCAARGIELRVISNKALGGFPGPPPDLTTQLSSSPADPSKKKVVVTGCYDWFHSGHVRFFEEASAYGDLYVDVGSDANIRLLKGEGHPLFPQAERLYMVRAVRNVCRAFIGTGAGWMDAVPEIELLKPDFYVVNEDGERPEKREFCAGRGIEYVVLKRTPKEGLPRRDSTTLRGF